MGRDKNISDRIRIEPQWNVNDEPDAPDGEEDNNQNRTIVECKYQVCHIASIRNRIRIEPQWNVNEDSMQSVG